MPQADGAIWADSDGQFIVTELGEVITLIPDIIVAPTGVWTEEERLRYEAWDAEE